jgi:hypothetical protein
VNALTVFSLLAGGVLALLLPLPTAQAAETAGYEVVDCLLPGQQRRLGSMVTYVSRRRPVKTSADQCEIRGGEYVLDDPANYRSALKIWQDSANAGDAQAQYYVGEIYEKGLAVGQPDYLLAAAWYRKAADQGFSRAAVNLGRLYEQGLGLARDPAEAARWYQRAAGLTPAQQAQVFDIDSAPQLNSLTSRLQQRDAEIARLRQQLERGESRGSAVVPVAIRSSDFGRYYALVIGNNRYRHWTPLGNAVRDAQAVGRLLEDHYGYRVTPLIDATRKEILSTLNQLVQTLTEKDNLLIYYAGHGHLEEQIDRGYWIPVDARLDDPTEWILTFQITDQLKIMSARHVLVVADSCYAGKLTRSSLTRLKPGLTEEKRLSLLKTFAQKRVRTALTSGGVRPVMDSGGSGHSVFTRAFLEVLQDNARILEAERMFLQIRARVAEAARRLDSEQIPTYEPIHLAGHESGDFVFVPRPSTR